MEMQFNKEVCPCLRQLISQVQTQEQTQEVRLSDGMPDIGRVLGCWGQVLIRGKEWRSSGMTLSGGVLAWVLYAPEDGSGVRSVDTWIPFQMKWDFSDSQRDGTILASPQVSGMDARCVSARKLLIRCGISVLGEAMEPSEQELYVPGQIPEDIQLLRNSYPMEVPLEAGEKPFELEEALWAPAQEEQIIRYGAELQVAEQRVMANRLVFRGCVRVHVLCCDGEGKLSSRDAQLPFSQFTDLDGDYTDNAVARILLTPTGLELERDEQGMLQLKCGVAAQYVIYDRVMIPVVEDAYSNRRSVTAQTQQLQLPARLDSFRESRSVEHTVSFDGQDILDAAWVGEHPRLQQKGDTAQISLPGQFQVLYTDEGGMLQSFTAKTEMHWDMPSDRNNRIRLGVQCDSQPVTEPGLEGLGLRQELLLDTDVFADAGVAMVTGLQMGELTEPDLQRPSLILRRAGSGKLWDVAKACGSTVEAIRSANGISEEPEAGQMLLIPVS